MKTGALLALYIALASCWCLFPPTVPSLDVKSYLGTWYQIASDPAVLDTFERDAVCVVAKYGAINASYVSVLNLERQSTVDGPVRNITGYATVPDASYPGRLSVHLDGVPLDAPYWVLNLGPVVNGQYSWAIISDDFCISLFVLSREPTPNATIVNDITSWLSSTGYFDMSTQYVPVLQAGCNYNFTTY
eukprot:TRINITY_DN1837_c0_g1_i1.p2 TRINITY_DN1837_c0_g1~~TRINITY_DN1837_c0_g1_i1.p2  ORF type:complete len:189 (-),score=40.15 TRINITY_DN1837_c0_g1_i1:618-1184(-)